MIDNEQETLRDARMAARGYREGFRDNDNPTSTWLLTRIVDLEIIARRTRKGSELAAYLIALDDVRAVIRTGPNV